MPGIYGGITCDEGIPRLLHAQFEKRWGQCEFYSGDWGGVGAHSFSGKALTRSGDTLVAVDGAASVYRKCGAEGAAFRPRPPITSAAGEPRLDSGHHGNAALIDTSSQECVLAVEASGSFPLYYTAPPSGGLVFSSNLEVLASVTQPRLDTLGILEYLRTGYTLVGRTYYSGIKRLQPGQVLSYTPRHEGTSSVLDRSPTWQTDAANGRNEPPLDEQQDRLWRRLVRSVDVALCESRAPALMLSAGWDSRTLLAAIQAGRDTDELLTYTHGEPRSRELILARKLAAIAQVRTVQRKIDDRIYDLAKLQTGFSRVGSVQFPHWHWAGENLLVSGRDLVTAGVYGEILGGHYGPAMASRGTSRALTTLLQILGFGFTGELDPASLLTEARDLIRRPIGKKPWYFAPAFWESLPDPQAALDADLEDSLARLHARGIDKLEALVEAFISEHRGTQLINMQLLSCRAHLDVAIPFADSELLLECSRLSLRERVQNKVNKKLLATHRRELLNLPCAATLVPAAWPILAQELSRGVRRAWESGWWRLHFLTGGAVGEPLLGWLNLQFLTDSPALTAVAEDIRSPIWDHAAIERKIASLRAGDWRASAHLLVDQLMKVYTVELSLRARSRAAGSK